MTNKCNCTEWILDLKTLNVTCECDRKKPKQKRTKKQEKPFTDPVFEELRNQIEAEKNA